jgi:hypothetical protein
LASEIETRRSQQIDRLCSGAMSSPHHLWQLVAAADAAESANDQRVRKVAEAARALPSKAAVLDAIEAALANPPPCEGGLAGVEAHLALAHRLCELNGFAPPTSRMPGLLHFFVRHLAYGFVDWEGRVSERAWLSLFYSFGLCVRSGWAGDLDALALRCPNRALFDCMWEGLTLGRSLRFDRAAAVARYESQSLAGPEKQLVCLRENLGATTRAVQKHSGFTSRPCYCVPFLGAETMRLEVCNLGDLHGAPYEATIEEGQSPPFFSPHNHAKNGYRFTLLERLAQHLQNLQSELDEELQIFDFFTIRPDFIAAEKEWVYLPSSDLVQTAEGVAAPDHVTDLKTETFVRAVEKIQPYYQLSTREKKYQVQTPYKIEFRPGDGRVYWLTGAEPAAARMLKPLPKGVVEIHTGTGETHRASRRRLLKENSNNSSYVFLERELWRPA